MAVSWRWYTRYSYLLGTLPKTILKSKNEKQRPVSAHNDDLLP